MSSPAQNTPTALSRCRHHYCYPLQMCAQQMSRRGRVDHGWAFGRGTRRAFVRVIQAGASRPAGRWSKRVSIHDIPLPGGGSARVAYDTKTQVIVSVLHPGWTPAEGQLR